MLWGAVAVGWGVFVAKLGISPGDFGAAPTAPDGGGGGGRVADFVAALGLGAVWVGLLIGATFTESFLLGRSSWSSSAKRLRRSIFVFWALHLEIAQTATTPKKASTIKDSIFGIFICA